jgi:hypothetical protein
MSELLMRWEDAREAQAQYRIRDIYRDKELALLLANGQTLQEAAAALGMKEDLAWAIANAPTFKLLVDRLRGERERAVYAENPDEMTESLARGNVWTLKQIRDNPTGKDAERLKAALALHEMRPSVRKQKQEENDIRVVFEVEVMDRLRDGLAKMAPAPAPVEAEYREVKET